MAKGKQPVPREGNGLLTLIRYPRAEQLYWPSQSPTSGVDGVEP